MMMVDVVEGFGVCRFPDSRELHKCIASCLSSGSRFTALECGILTPSTTRLKFQNNTKEDATYW